MKDEISTSKKEIKKELTIPQLELLAVLSGIRAIKFVTKELRLKIARRILWTDSQHVLHWLKTKKPLSVFIENRIEEIKSEKDVIFCYVATDHNPPYLATRGLSVQNIMCSSLYSGMDHSGFNMMIHCGQHGIFLMLFLKSYSK